MPRGVTNRACQACDRAFQGGPAQRWCSKECVLTQKRIDADGCWLWTGETNCAGYGVVYGRELYGKRQARVHRVSYEFHKGAIPPGLFVCHTCDVRSCFNPEHLYAGTSKENSRDMVERQRYQKERPLVRGENSYRSKLTEEQVRAIRRDPRSIKTIAKDYPVSWQAIGLIKSRRNWKHID